MGHPQTRGTCRCSGALGPGTARCSRGPESCPPWASHGSPPSPGGALGGGGQSSRRWHRRKGAGQARVQRQDALWQGHTLQWAVCLCQAAPCSLPEQVCCCLSLCENSKQGVEPRPCARGGQETVSAVWARAWLNRAHASREILPILCPPESQSCPRGTYTTGDPHEPTDHTKMPMEGVDPLQVPG